MTHFEWTEVSVGPIRAVTPAAGEAVEEVTPEMHLKKVLGIDDAVRKKDTRPTLVYFHWPHEDPEHGKLTTTLCERVLNEEMVARWGKLYRCVQIDMGASETKHLELVGFEGEPGFSVLDADLKVVSKFPGHKSSTKLCKELEAAHDKLPEHRKALKKALKEQEKALDEARKLEKADKFDEALKLVDPIRFGNIRVGPDWEKAVFYGQLLAQKAEKAAAEK